MKIWIKTDKKLVRCDNVQIISSKDYVFIVDKKFHLVTFREDGGITYLKDFDYEDDAIKVLNDINSTVASAIARSRDHLVGDIYQKI